MKRSYFIEVNIDDETPLPKSSRVETTEYSSRIFITQREKDEGYDYELPNILAHELGHVIGQIFHTPGNISDPRMPANMAMRMFATKDQNMKNAISIGIKSSEQEAWRFGEQIIKTAAAKFEQDKATALGTYERDYKIVESE